ncbi:MAG: class I SAM-dependent methyltransferase [Lachnospiraceae bacterium]|nr:class I SAM-dependent methyltransferase [Lachnospiraceae bacterium]
MYIFLDQTEAKTAEIEAQYHATVVREAAWIPPEELVLHFTPELVSLEQGNLEMHGDLTTMLPRIRRLSQEMLVKAARIKDAEHPLVAIDATAGMGEDSLVLAAAGYQVKLFEYNPVIAALLQDSLRRAAFIPELEEVVARMEFVPGDSIAGIAASAGTVDLIYLDPMFPERQKSGLIKKKFQLMQQLERPCDDEEALFQSAYAAAPKKLVIKRPLKGPYLAGRKPGYTIKGKAIRYDCFACS